MTQFKKGDLLVSRSRSQYLVFGRTYLVVDLEIDRTPFGGYTRYLVRESRDEDAVPFWVTNGHLLLERI